MVSSVSIANSLKPTAAASKPAEEAPRDSLALSTLETACGTVQLVNRLPGAIIPGLVAGVANGVTGGMEEKQLVRVLDVASGVQVALALVLLKGKGKKGLKLIRSGGTVAQKVLSLLPAGDDRARLARELAAHKPEGNFVQRALSGAAHGLTLTVGHNVRGALEDGKADAAGLWEGGQLVPVILQDGENPESWLTRLAGGVSAVLMVPGAVVDGLAQALDQKELSSPLLVTAGSVAVVALVGAATLGAPAAAVGGGLALIASVRGAGQAHEKVEQYFAHLEAHDLGDEEANDRKDVLGAVLVGGAAGARAGYGAWA